MTTDSRGIAWATYSGNKLDFRVTTWHRRHDRLPNRRTVCGLRIPVFDRGLIRRKFAVTEPETDTRCRRCWG